MFEGNSDKAYKGIVINHEDNTIRIVCETEDREECDMEVYLDKCDEPSPDKDYCYTWLVIETYKYNTKLENKDK
jgi:acylphosphatase